MDGFLHIPDFPHFAELMCRTTVAHGAMCIDLVPLSNGPNADQDPIEFVQPIPDHVHLNQKGHDMVANAIASVGFVRLADKPSFRTAVAGYALLLVGAAERFWVLRRRQCDAGDARPRRCCGR